LDNRFTVSKVLNTKPVTYKIKDNNEDEIEVEKILKTRNGKKEFKILWRGYPLSIASWISAENLKNQFGSIRGSIYISSIREFKT
jgi:hypothetical protein